MLKRFQIDKDIARARAVFGSDDSAVLKCFHDPGSAIVTDSQAALEHGGRGSFGAAQYFNRILEKLIDLLSIAVETIFVAPFAIDRLLDLLRITGRTIFFEGFTDARAFIVRNKSAL